MTLPQLPPWSALPQPLTENHFMADAARRPIPAHHCTQPAAHRGAWENGTGSPLNTIIGARWPNKAIPAYRRIKCNKFRTFGLPRSALDEFSRQQRDRAVKPGDPAANKGSGYPPRRQRGADAGLRPVAAYGRIQVGYHPLYEHEAS
jgi:hypothetical protein